MIYAAVAVISASTGLGAAYAVSAMPWRRLRGKHALIGMTNGATYEGTVVRRCGPTVELLNVRKWLPSGEPVPVDGRGLIERRNIEYIQYDYGGGER